MLKRATAFGLVIGAILATSTLGGCASTPPAPGAVAAREWDTSVEVTLAGERRVAREEAADARLAQAVEQALLAQQPLDEPRFRPHVFNVFLGGTTDRGGGGVTVGGQYEYRFSKHFGVGGFLDGTFVEIAGITMGIGAYYRPVERLVLLAAPGVEFVDRHTHFITRVGAAYEFAIDNFTFAPAIYADLFSGWGTPIIAGVYWTTRF